jgi:hypothetical protein
MKIVQNSASFFLLFACLLFNYVRTADAADRQLAKANMTILGLTIGDCTSLDIYSKMGPGIPFRKDANPDISQVCYVSDKDDTLILFSFDDDQCVRFKLMLHKNKFYKWHFCERSPLVSKHLTTESGIKLGMSKRRLKAILGVSRNESRQYLKYDYEWQQKMSRVEIETTSQGTKNMMKDPFWTVNAAIQAEFSEAGLISFDLLKIRQY